MDSLMAQTVTSWTLCIHDDASAIDVKTILEPYLKDPRVTCTRSEKRLGIAGNWNACLSHAEGPYIQFLFQDDLWEPRYLERALNALEEHATAGLAATNHRYRLEQSTDARTSNLQQQAPSIYGEVTEARRAMIPGVHGGLQFLHEWSKNGLRPNIVGEPSFVMLRKSVTDRVGLFANNMKQGLDMEYWIRALAISDIVWIPEEGGDFRVHAQAASSVNEQSGSGLTDRLQCYETLLHALPQERTRIKKDLRAALAGMINKYQARTQAGGGSKGMKKGWLIGFGLRHPLISLRAFQDAKRQARESRKTGKLGR